MATLLGTYHTYYKRTVSNNPSSLGDWRWRFEIYLNSQSIANNTSNVTVKSFIQFSNAPIRDNIYGDTTSFEQAHSAIRINGVYTNKYYNLPIEILTNRTYEFSSHTFTVIHESSGKGGFDFYGRGRVEFMAVNPWWDGYTGTVTTQIDLPNIPRYAIITSYSVVNNGLNSIRVTWNTDATCDSSQYSLNGGAWQNAPAWKDFTIGNLNPGTQYSVKIRVKRTDSQLWTESSVKYATTTDIAKITSAPDNIIMGDDITVVYSNPSGSPLSISIYKTDGMTAIAPYRACSGTSYTFTLTEEEKNNMYNSIPTTNDTRFRIYIRTEAGSNYLHYAERKFVLTDANPIFNNFAYEDINAKTTGLTGNNQIIIKDYSNLMATISTTDKAIAQKGATMKTYQFVVGSKQISANYSDIDDVNLSLNSINNNVFSVYAIDSRGNSTLKQISPANYIDYFKPVITNAYAERTGNVGDETTLYLDGSFFNNTFGSATNDITVSYKYKKTSDTTYLDGTTTITPTKNSNNFSFEGKIAGDKEALGFDSGYSYDIVITVTDKLDKAEFSFILGSGKPNLAIHRDGVAVNAPYDEELGGALQIEGNRLIEWEEI